MLHDETLNRAKEEEAKGGGNDRYNGVVQNNNEEETLLKPLKRLPSRKSQTSSPRKSKDDLRSNQPTSARSSVSMESTASLATSLKKSSFRSKSFSSSLENGFEKDDFVSVDLVRKRLTQQSKEEREKNKEKSLNLSLLQQSFNTLSMGATSKPKEKVLTSPSSLKKLSPTNKQVANREETDSFVKGFQYIEEINKKKDRTPVKIGRPISSREASSSRIQSSELLQNNNPISEKLSNWEDFENKTQNENKSKISSQEPLRLQYDPSQIRMDPVMLTNSPLGPNSKKNAIKELKMMAEACNRAGRHKMEALIHYKIGTKYEDINDPASAVSHYEQFLGISEGLKDEVGKVLALNCLGVAYQKMGGEKNLNTALKYHMSQWEIADEQSKIVANINIGLIFQELGHNENAVDNYRMAFQAAYKIGDQQGESIALANLGYLGMEQGDLATAQACLERHLTLSEALKDMKGESEAYQQLGILASKKGEGELAVQMLEKARMVASTYDSNKAEQIKCSIGIVEGNNRFDEYMRNLASNFINKN
ncbi:hypothetical protein ABK040_005481 [Willaertia magna]